MMLFTVLLLVIVLSATHDLNNAFAFTHDAVVPTRRSRSSISKNTQPPSCSFRGAFAVVSSLRPCLSWHRLSSSSDNNDDDDGTGVLLDSKTFHQKNRLDTTLRNLRKQLPSLLTVALTPQSASLVYTDDIQLVGPRGEILLSGMEELVSMSSSLVLATSAAQTAQRALLTLGAADAAASSASSSPSSGGGGGSSLLTQPTVDCSVVVSTNDTKRLFVQWSAPLPIADNKNKNRLVQGVSELILNDDDDDDSNKISIHRLVDVTIDGRTVVAVGEGLATLRRAVRSVQGSNLLKDLPFLGAALNDVRDGILAVAASSTSSSSMSVNTELMDGSPLYVTNSSTLTSIFPISSSGSSSTKNDESVEVNKAKLVPMDKIQFLSFYPLPGSLRWQDYSSAHNALIKFRNHGIPTLAGEQTTDYDYSNDSIFAPDATLIGVDKNTIILQGGHKILKVYQTLSMLRKASMVGSWMVQSVKSDWLRRTCTIRWKATNNPPPTPTLEGMDRFTLNEDGEVETMEMLELSMGGNAITDSELIRSIVMVMEKSDGVLPGADIMSDLFYRLTMAGKPTSSSLPASSSGAAAGPPRLKDEAAISVYHLMCDLHDDLTNLIDLPTTTNNNNNNSPSLKSFSYLDDDVTLRGYMGELLLPKGSTTYKQTVSVSIASLKTAVLRTKNNNILQAHSPPVPTIEFTSCGNLKVSLLLDFRVRMTMINPVGSVVPNVMNELLQNSGISSAATGGGGVPLKVKVVSEYKLNKYGKIKEHQLLETRINDRLTPADIVSRWIQGMDNGDGNDNKSDNMSSALWDAVAWATKSIGNSNNPSR